MKTIAKKPKSSRLPKPLRHEASEPLKRGYEFDADMVAIMLERVRRNDRRLFDSTVGTILTHYA